MSFTPAELTNKWDYQITLGDWEGDVWVEVEYFARVGGVSEHMVVSPPNWFEKLRGITWSMKVSKANQDLERIARKKVAKWNACIEFVDRYKKSLEESDGQIR